MFTNSLTRILFLGLIGISFNLSAQIDTVYFVSGEFLIGEVQKMEKNILEVETTFSDEDFNHANYSPDSPQRRYCIPGSV